MCHGLMDGAMDGAMEWVDGCDDEDDMSTLKTTCPPEGRSHVRTAFRLEATQGSALGGGLGGRGLGLLETATESGEVSSTRFH